jgi:hypothetical protein
MKTEHIHRSGECTNFLAFSKMWIKRITKCNGGLSGNVGCEIMLSVPEGKKKLCILHASKCWGAGNTDSGTLLA